MTTRQPRAVADRNAAAQSGTSEGPRAPADPAGTERPARTRRWGRLRREHQIIVALVVLLAVVAVLSLSIGRYGVPPIETVRILTSQVAPVEITWTAKMHNVITSIRFPRVVADILVGGALALAGASYQGLFRNPLVSPDILGVAAGACLGAAIGILAGAPAVGIQACALAGGLIAVMLATAIPRFFRNSSALMLVLSGVIVTGLLSSLLGLTKYLADPEQELASIVFWTMGSFSTVGNGDLLKMAVPILVTTVVLLLYRWRLNLLALGEVQAQALGVNVRSLRRLVIVCATVLTASAVSVSGTIGWVGLVMPHVARLLVGQDSRFVLPTSFLLGGSFMMVVDSLARNLTETEIPISILTGVIGTPLFIFLLMRQRARIE